MCITILGLVAIIFVNDLLMIAFALTVYMIFNGTKMIVDDMVDTYKKIKSI